jgi:hypothetical protein
MVFSKAENMENKLERQFIKNRKFFLSILFCFPFALGNQLLPHPFIQKDGDRKGIF